ncbi:MAG: glycosyltransferase family 2 protein [Alphaproteobacteria bacterium]|nr:glycosyltransferase family 2 protein [Alphaproteobacteria bacterium]
MDQIASPADAAIDQPHGMRYGELARIEVLASVSIVVPTYREVENIPLIVERIARVRNECLSNLELIFVDDNSADGSVEAVEALGLDWVRMIVRTDERGLSSAVIHGFRAARGAVLVCMDGDLSHPPEVIPQMILALDSGQQFVIGSRYVPGGSTDDDWGILRWLNSRVATVLSRPFTSVRDPMSGFFALRKTDFDAAANLDPVGYKIGLELIVKCDFENVAEIPIRFADRVHGESKLSLKEQLQFLRHLRRLYVHAFGNAMHFLQFAAVGASGVVVNFAVLTLLLWMQLPEAACLAGGIVASLISNFLLNRRITFSYARHGNIWLQFVGFVGASSLGMMVNYGVALYLNATWLQGVPYGLYAAALCGITTGLVFNFLGNRYLVFRTRYIRR